jgi:hypothetical protein
VIRRALKDDTPCTATWPITGKPCRHLPMPGLDVCEAHHPDGDQRVPPPSEEVRCTGTNRESGERCRRPHRPGGKVCNKHGGNARAPREAADRRTAIKRVKQRMETYGAPVKIAPEHALLVEIHRTAGHVAWLEQQVHALTEGELVWGVTRVKEGGEDRGVTEEAVPHALLRLYQEERAHLVKACAAALRAGVEERQVKLAESQGALVAQTIRAILGDLNLNATQKALVPLIVPQRLRELALTN